MAFSNYAHKLKLTHKIIEMTINGQPAVADVCTQTGGRGLAVIFDDVQSAHEYALSLVGGKVFHRDELAHENFRSGSGAEYEAAKKLTIEMRKLRRSRKSSTLFARRVNCSRPHATEVKFSEVSA